MALSKSTVIFLTDGWLGRTQDLLDHCSVVFLQLFGYDINTGGIRSACSSLRTKVLIVNNCVNGNLLKLEGTVHVTSFGVQKYK